MSATSLVHSVQSKVDNGVFPIDVVTGFVAPPLRFIEMGGYGTASYFEHFREHVDSVAVWQRRQALTANRREPLNIDSVNVARSMAGR